MSQDRQVDLQMALLHNAMGNFKVNVDFEARER